MLGKPVRKRWESSSEGSDKKSIPEQTERATAHPRPPLESSRRDAFKSALTIFVMFFGENLAFLAPQKWFYKNSPGRFECSLSRAFKQWSWTGHSSLSLLEKWFLSQPVRKIPTVVQLVYQALNLIQIGRCLFVVQLVSRPLAYGAVKIQHYRQKNDLGTKPMTFI